MSRGNLLKVLCLSMLGALLTADLSMAQFRGGGPGMGRGGSALGLLANDRVRDELELVDDQVEAIEALTDDMRAEMQDMFSGMRDNFRNMNEDERREFMEEIREKMTNLNKDFEGRVFDELLPHQVDRLKQLMFQSQSGRGGGLSRGSIPENLIEELGITEDQIEKMREKAESVREDLNKKIAKLQQQAEEEILSVLDAEQRERYKELMGESFDFGENRFGGFGGRGPGGDGGRERGGRGGDRGGDRGGSDF